MNNSVLYDVSVAPLFEVYEFLWVGLLFVFVGLLYFYGSRRILLNYKRENINEQFKRKSVAFLSFSVLFFLGTSYASFITHKKLTHITPLVVEGEVYKFRDAGLSGKQPESFCIESTCFSYHSSINTGGFNHVRIFGGPIQEGIKVRISHINGVIVKIEKIN